MIHFCPILFSLTYLFPTGISVWLVISVWPQKNPCLVFFLKLEKRGGGGEDDVH